jgi:hypothetical protein
VIVDTDGDGVPDAPAAADAPAADVPPDDQPR